MNYSEVSKIIRNLESDDGLSMEWEIVPTNYGEVKMYSEKFIKILNAYIKSTAKTPEEKMAEYQQSISWTTEKAFA